MKISVCPHVLPWLHQLLQTTSLAQRSTFDFNLLEIIKRYCVEDCGLARHDCWIHAVTYNDVPRALYYLSKGVRVNGYGTKEESARNLSLKHRDCRIFREIMKDPKLSHEPTSFRELNAFHAAVTHKNWPALQQLLRHPSVISLINVPNRVGCTPLQISLRTNQPKVAKELLRHGASAHDPKNEGTYLCDACEHPGTAHLIPCLVEAKACLSLSTDKHSALSAAVWRKNLPGLRQLLRLPNVSSVINVSSLLMKSTPLQMALEFNRPKIAMELLRHGASPDGLGSTGATCLHYASERRETAYLIPRLFEAKASFSLAWNNQSALHVAVEKNNSPALQQLLRHPNVSSVINTSSSWGNLTALQMALRDNRIELVVGLLLNHASAEGVCQKGRTSLHYAMLHQETTCFIPLLIKAKAGFYGDGKRKFSTSALSFACENRNHLAVQLLLENKANLWERDSNGNTYFHAAAQWGHPRVWDALYGAWRRQAYSRSRTRFRSRFGPRFRSRFGLRCGPRFGPNVQNHKGENPLFFVHECQSVSLVQRLLESKVDVNAPNRFGETPFLVACAIGSEEVVKVMLRAKADTLVVNVEGEDVFDYARERNGLVSLLKWSQFRQRI